MEASLSMFTVSWDDGAVGINYTVVERFTLISRASESARQ